MGSRTRILLTVAVVVLFVTGLILRAVLADDAVDDVASSASSATTSTTTSPPATSSTPATSVPATSAPATSVPTTSTTIPAPTTTLAPADDPGAGTALAEPVPLGGAVEVGQWRVGISHIELDGTDTILEYVDFNEPPAEGSQYVVVELSGVYLGGGFVQPVFEWALVKSGFTHVPDGLECGVVPNSIYDVPETTTGGQFTGNLCFEVPSAEVTDDLVLTLGLIDDQGRETFFALD